MKNLHKTGNPKLANCQKNGTRLHYIGTTQDHDTERTIVLDKFKVDAFLYESVQTHLNEMLPYLLPDGVYTWQEILGETFFADMAMPRHLPMLCLKHLTQQPGSHLIISPFSDGGTTYFEIN